MEGNYPIDDRNKVKRIPKRGHYDRETVYGILNDAFLAHVSFMMDGQPFIIPTAYGRRGDDLYFHGATTSRLLVALQTGIPTSVAVTHLDGIVLARSLFHSSMNYRSVVAFGTATLVEDADEKMEALKIISDQIMPGRWEEARLPNPKEMKATTVLKMKIETASAKIRTGPPGDDKDDYQLPIWAGVLPCNLQYQDAQTDPDSIKDLPVSASVITYYQSKIN
ncbi:MAG: pyridoxamine 5'-phosphate oxidase family protein [Saprospiraceae bacterium]|nr:pyridoxamine 5'-phosphate oxidase family protein [Saprospiraceae bacterium]